MLRTEYYLWKAKRLGGGNAALSTAQSSVDAVLKAGYALLPTFADIFNLSNEANSELIWTLPYIVNENVTPGTSPNFFAYYLAPNGDRTRLTQAYCDFLAEDARDTRTDVSVRVFEDKFLTEEVQIKRMVVKFKGSFANDTRSFDSDVPVYRLAEAYLLKAEVENALKY